MTMEMAPLLLGLVTSLAKDIVAGSVRAALAARADLVERAINATSNFFPEIEGVETNLRNWTASEDFVGFCERIHAGEHDIDDEIIASFVQMGEFYFPTEEERLYTGARVVAVFLSQLLNAIYRSEEGLVLHAARQESLQRDTRNEINQRTAAGFADLKAVLPSLIAQAISAATPAETEQREDQAHIELTQKIDLARDLIKRGKVHSARAVLELLISDNEDMPNDLRFRAVTNLGACAISDGDQDTAISCFNEAHGLQLDNLLGIGNAALAAHLSRDQGRARELAMTARELDPRDSQATHVLISALWEEEREELEALLDGEEWIKKDKRCGVALSRVRIHQSRFAEAAELCRSLVDSEPEDAATHLALSECLLAYALSDRMKSGSGHEFHLRLREAESEASTAIDLLSATELSVQRREALVARAGARALMGATEDAMNDLNEVLAEAPANPDALLSKGLLLLDERRSEEARSALEGTRDSERFAEALMPLAQACVLSGDDRAAAEILRGTFSLERPGWDEVRKAEMYYRAQAAIGDKESAVSAIEKALRDYPDDPRLLALESVRCGILDDLDGAEEPLLKALDCSEEADQREIQIRLGILYQNQGRFSEAADKFNGDVDGHVAHPAAIPLLMSLVNGKRLREALEWARKIREQHPQPHRIALEVEADILNYVGDVPKEIACREALCRGTEVNSVDFVKLALAQLRGGRRDEALATVQGVRDSDLHQEPKWLMTLAQLKLLLGDEDYIDTAYLARRLGINDPEVHLGYFGLFLGRDNDWVEPEIVGPGCAVLLKNEHVEQWWLILEEGDEAFGLYEKPHNDELSLKLLGLRSGVSIVLREGIEDLSYEIAKIQSKYVRAFQETIEDFSTRFPGHMGMSWVSIDDSFSKVFRTIDQRDLMVRELEGMYLNGKLPLVSLASLLGRSVPEVWSACTTGTFVPIRIRTGADSEVIEARELLQEADVVILDLVALLTVHELGLAEKLHTRFPCIAVPQFVIDELQKLHAETAMAPP